jgi:hypothetical protein
VKLEVKPIFAALAVPRLILTRRLAHYSGLVLPLLVSPENGRDHADYAHSMCDQDDRILFTCVLSAVVFGPFLLFLAATTLIFNAYPDYGEMSVNGPGALVKTVNVVARAIRYTAFCVSMGECFHFAALRLIC